MGIPFLSDHLMFFEKKSQGRYYRDSCRDWGYPKEPIGWFNLARFYGPYPDTHEAILDLKELEPGRSIKIGVYTITPYIVNHPVPASGYLVEDERERRFFYTGDTGPRTPHGRRSGRKRSIAWSLTSLFPTIWNRLRSEQAIWHLDYWKRASENEV